MSYGHRSSGGALLAPHALDPVANLRAADRVDRSFHGPLVVVDKEPRWREDLGELFLHLFEFQGAGDGIGRAAPQFALVVDRGAVRAEIDARRQGAQDLDGRAIEPVPLVGQVGDPTVPLNLAYHATIPLDQESPQLCHVAWGASSWLPPAWDSDLHRGSSADRESDVRSRAAWA